MHGIRVQVLPVDVMPSSLRRFDHHRRRLMLSELVDVHGRTFQTAYQLALIEWRDVIDAIATRLEPEQSPAKALLRVSLANYAAAALMMPYQKFLDAAEALNYDIDVLGARFQASFEQVAHRLTTLNRTNARGVPFFLIRIDNAGNVSKRFAAGNFPFSRFGGTCPLWSLHETFSSPGAFMTEIVELPDGAKWFSIARTVRRAASAYGDAEGQFAIGLGCELKYASRLIYARKFDLKAAPATQIGVNCRLCERENCAQRAAPPITRKLRVDESIRGVELSRHFSRRVVIDKFHRLLLFAQIKVEHNWDAGCVQLHIRQIRQGLVQQDFDCLYLSRSQLCVAVNVSHESVNQLACLNLLTNIFRMSFIESCRHSFLQKVRCYAHRKAEQSGNCLT